MAQLGKADASIVLCNQCGKRIAIKGIKIQEKNQGEYVVTFFACPHCGRVYQINTMDQRQQELFKQRDEAIKKIVEAVQFRFRQKTIQKYRKEDAIIKKKIERRARMLWAIGEEILGTGSEAKADGSENSDCGAESVQRH